MVYRIPRSPIALKNTHIWANYEPGLCATPFVRKYLHGILRKWVEDSRQIHNPLVLPWLRHLVLNNSGSPLSRLDQILEKLEQVMDEDNMHSLVNDLLSKPADARGVLTAIASFWGEVTAFERLRTMTASPIRKITEYGDWEVDGMPVSVKTLVEMSHNYWTIQETLVGYACLAECRTLGRASTIRLLRAEGLDDLFMKDILWFIETDLDGVLEFLLLDLSFPDWYTASVESTRVSGLDRAGEDGRLQLSAMRHCQDAVQLALRDIRGGAQDAPRSHRIELSVELGEDTSGVLRISTDHDAWWGNPNLDQVNKNLVGKKIRAALDKIAEARRKSKASMLVGWINFGVHPSLQTGMASDPANFREFLSSLVRDSDLPVIVCPYEVFEVTALPFIVVFRDADPRGAVVYDNTSPVFSELVGGNAGCPED